MTLKEELQETVDDIFISQWDIRTGTVVPDDDSIGLEGNEGVELDATILYSDLSSSTALVQSMSPSFAAEIYKAFLHCSAKIIRGQNGKITAYDGDRVMAVFIGGTKSNSAVKAAMRIAYAVQDIINPTIARIHGKDFYTVNHVTGIDASKVLVAQTGVRGARDLVWVGRAANYAAKLSNLNGKTTYITSDVYGVLTSENLETKNGLNMWEKVERSGLDVNVYGTTYRWTF